MNATLQLDEGPTSKKDVWSGACMDAFDAGAFGSPLDRRVDF